MLLTCPACQTRYQVPDDAVDPVLGRDLQCANCGHRWHVGGAEPRPPSVVEPIAPRPEPVAPRSEPLVAPPEPIGPRPEPIAPRPEPIASRPPPPRVEPIPPAEPPPLPAAPRPEPDAAPRPVAAPRRRRGGVGCLVLLLILAAIVAIPVVARDRVVAMWPGAAPLYRAIGLKSEPIGAGLDIAKVTPTRNADGLTIEGDVINSSVVPRSVPKLRVALRDAYQRELTTKVIDPPAARLLPGETAHFKTAFDHPSDAAADVAVTFAGAP